LTLNLGFKSKAEEIEWRRSKILELKSQGLDQREIAQILKVTPALITLDLRHIREEAKENVREYTTERLPLQFRIFTKAKDDHDRIDAMEYYIGSHQTLWSLLIGGEKFENSRQSESRLALYQQRQQLIIGQDRT
jgi:hypothetical protein